MNKWRAGRHYGIHVYKEDDGHVPILHISDNGTGVP